MRPSGAGPRRRSEGLAAIPGRERQRASSLIHSGESARNDYVPTQRPATVALRTSLFEDATAIVEREYSSELVARRHRPPHRLLPPPAAARLRGGGEHDLPRAPDAGPDGPGRRDARAPQRHRARGRAPRGLPPAGAVREGLPALSGRRPVGLPGQRLPSPTGRRASSAWPPSAPTPRAPIGAHRFRLSRQFCNLPPPWGWRARWPRARPAVHNPRREQGHVGRAHRDRRRRVAARDRARAPDRLVPRRRLRRGRPDRHGLGRARDRLRADLRAGHDDRPVLASGASACIPGEEDLDGPPIHGNTRLEIIWTAIPAIMLVALCSYAYVVLTDIEEASADPALEVRVVGEQFTWTFFYANPDEPAAGGRLAAALRAAGAAGALHRPVQGRHPRLLGPGLPHEDRRRARDRHGDPRHADADRRVPRRLRRALRPRPRGDAPDRPRPPARRVRLLAAGARAAGRGRRRGGAAARRRPAAARRAAPRTARPSSPPRAAAAATRSRTRARPAAPGPTSTRASPARTRRSSRRASSTRRRRSPRASRTGSCRRATVNR